MMLTLSIDPWIVPHLLARVNVNPSPLVLTVDLSPDVVFAVPHPADSCTSSTAQHAEAVGELSRSSSSGFEKCPNFAISGKSLKCLAVDASALV